MPASAPQVDLILRKVDQLPPLPAAAVRVLKATRDDQPDLRALTLAVEADPSIAARVIGAANRSDTGTRSVATVERAVVKLGVQAVRSLVLSLSVVDAMSGAAVEEEAEGGFTRVGFWRHSLAVATAAESLAEAGRSAGPAVNPGEAFCAGLMHDLGKLALRIAFPKAHARVCEAAGVLRCDLCRLEREIIGVDHQAAGRRLAERWGLPGHLRDVIFLHNTPPDELESLNVATPKLVHLVSLADSVVRRLHLGYSANHAFGTPRERLLRELNIEPAKADATIALLVERVRERSGLLGLDDATTDQIYRDAVATADRELRASEAHLAEARKRLVAEKRSRREEAEQGEQRRREAADQVQGFGHVASLAEAVGPEATVRSTLGCIAATACSVLANRASTSGSTPAAVAYARCEGGVVTVGWGGDGEASHAIEPGATDAHALIVRAALPREVTRINLADLGGILVPSDGLAFSGDLIAGWTLALRLVLERERQASSGDRLAEQTRALASARQQAVRDRSLLAVAEMAAGAAHEMNNPLMVISGRSQQLYRDLGDPRLKRAALAIYQNAGRLAEMVAGLMRYARPEVAKRGGEAEHADIERTVAEALELVAASTGDALPGGLRIEQSLPPNLPSVAIDNRQWSRAIAAVVENAVQATPPDGGCVRISAAMDGDRIQLTIEDDGAGMDEATLARAFDPFFSGLAAGRRRGMGLTVAQRLVELDGGTLALESEPGHGTRATLHMPIATPASGSARRQRAA